MSTIEEVQSFLSEFKLKMNVYDVVFRDDRSKNSQTLLDLEIRPVERKSILTKLNPEDYSDGPTQETLYGGSDMWIFGKMVKGYEVYIKISMGVSGSSVMCISFHIAEYRMNYPFKK